MSINEIYVGHGTLDDSVYPKFIQMLMNRESGDKVIKKTKEYLKKVLGAEKYKKNDLVRYIDGLTYGYIDTDLFSSSLTSIDTISNLCYFLAKEFLKLKKGVDLEYVSVENKWDTSYFFFDPEIEEIVGRMDVGTKINFETPFSKKNSAKVEFSALDKYSKGQGHGKNMYLTLLKLYNIIYSDQTLYTDSLNIWVNVLPNYVNTHGYLTEYGEPKKLESIRNVKLSEVDRFFASNKNLYF
jgi:hypothetical protein